MEEYEALMRVIFMHAALQGAAAARPTGEHPENTARRAWDIANAAMDIMPPDVRQALAAMDDGRG